MDTKTDSVRFEESRRMVAEQLEEGLINEEEAEHFLELIEAHELQEEVYDRYWSIVNQFEGGR